MSRKDFGRKGKNRNFKTRNQRRYFLIVTNGEKTEKNYFESFKRRAPRGTIRVSVKVEKGDPARVLDRAREERDKATPKPDETWIVFDKDEFSSFSDAVSKARGMDIEPGWSNECVELWFLLHFDRVGSVNRNTCRRLLERKIRDAIGNKSYEYEKGDEDIAQILRVHGDEAEAVKHAETVMSQAKKANPDAPWEVNPSTRIHELVRKLRDLEVK